jgi:hypothetical protein
VGDDDAAGKSSTNTALSPLHRGMMMMMMMMTSVETLATLAAKPMRGGGQTPATMNDAAAVVVVAAADDPCYLPMPTGLSPQASRPLPCRAVPVATG